jgi:hypothetical protein
LLKPYALSLVTLRHLRKLLHGITPLLVLGTAMGRAGLVFVFAVVLGTSPASAQEDAAEPAPTNTQVYSAPEQDESWKQDVLVALIGGGVRTRWIRYEVGDGSGGTEPRSLDTGPYFDFAWHLFIRPVGHRSPRPTMRAMVLQLDGAAGIGLSVEPEGTGITLRTNTWRMLGQFGYLYPKDRAQFGGLVGIGGDVFNIDLNSVLSSSRIVYVRLGPAASFDAVGTLLTIRGDFGLRFPFHLGQLANAFGQDTRTLGLDAVLTLQGRLKAGFTYAARLNWEYYRFWFAGPVDNVPAMGGGGDGQDHALTFQLLVGWSL